MFEYGYVFIVLSLIMIQNPQCLASGDYKFPHRTCADLFTTWIWKKKKCTEHFVQRNLTSKREIKNH